MKQSQEARSSNTLLTWSLKHICEAVSLLFKPLRTALAAREEPSTLGAAAAATQTVFLRSALLRRQHTTTSRS
eukprot:18361-Heterococcus_DN1.PRE.2